MKVGVTVDYTNYWVREPSDDDQWDSGEEAITIHGISAREASWGDELDVNKGDVVHAVVEHYSDGNTFGNQEYAEVKAVYKTDWEAQAWIDGVEKPDHGYFGSHIDFKIFSAVVQ